jgi:hypothetical protein
MKFTIIYRMILFGMGIGLISCGNADSKHQHELASYLGEALCETVIESYREDIIAQGGGGLVPATNIDKVNASRYYVTIEDGLMEELMELQLELWQDYEIEVYERDNDKENGKASHFIIIKSKGEERFGIRLKYDKDADKFHILGYWTIEPNFLE